MLDQRAFLKVHESSFVFLLPVGQALSIERRQVGSFDVAGDADSLLCAHYIAGGDSVPVIRLARLLDVPAGEWGYAILLGGESGRVAVAAEHIHVVLDTERPRIQPFNPAGVVVDGEPLITGACPDTEPEHLVLDPAWLQRCVQNAAARAGGG